MYWTYVLDSNYSANSNTFTAQMSLGPDGTLDTYRFVSGAGTSDFSSGTIKFKTINVPTSSGGSTYGPGTSGQILKSNGTTVYWAADNNSDSKVL
jgi:hypothetical protein